MQTDIVKGLNELNMSKYSVWDKMALLLLGLGVLCFGFVLPDSFSDHNKLVHFSAHFGMSFLLALCFYTLCSVKLRSPKAISYTVLISATLIIGIIYKFWEIATQGLVGNYSFQIIMDKTGCLTSISQNLSGLMAAILVIESLLHKNLKPNPINKPSFKHLNQLRSSN
jgi:glucan phosphoethanolaminetransferase (alkaline phosphatase superfamily)